MNEASRETRTAVVERNIPHPPEKIWRALTQPHLIAEWLMKNDFRPDVGHSFTLQAEWGGKIDCEVLAVEPHTSLSYKWRFESGDPLYSLDSVVTFTLTPTPNGTQLRVEQEGFRPDQKQAFGGANAAWKAFFKSLEEVVARLD